MRQRGPLLRVEASLVDKVVLAVQTAPAFRAVQDAVPIRVLLLIRVGCAGLVREVCLSRIHHQLGGRAIFRSHGLVRLEVLPRHPKHVLHLTVQTQLLRVSEATTYQVNLVDLLSCLARDWVLD